MTDANVDKRVIGGTLVGDTLGLLVSGYSLLVNLRGVPFANHWLPSEVKN